MPCFRSCFFWVGSAAAVFSACTSPAEVAADMERALGESSTALVGVLLAAEVLSQAAEPPDTTLRHGDDACGCPCAERTGTDPVIITLDYHTDGCLPQSGLLPSGVAGFVVLDCAGGDCTATFDGFFLALSHPVEGTLTGRFTPGETLALTPSGSLSVGDADFDLDLALDVADGTVMIDGTVTINALTIDDAEPRPVVFAGGSLSEEGRLGRCPAPGAGTATLSHDNPDKGSVVRYAEPGDGTVTVVRGKRVSEPADYCAYASDLW